MYKVMALDIGTKRIGVALSDYLLMLANGHSCIQRQPEDKAIEEIQKIIKENISSDTDLVIKNTICHATELRQKETEEISKKVQFMIIIGGKNSSNTKKLYEIGKKNCENCICIETAEDIDFDKIKNYDKIGVMAGASTPQELIEKVIDRLNKNI